MINNIIIMFVTHCREVLTVILIFLGAFLGVWKSSNQHAHVHGTSSRAAQINNILLGVFMGVTVSWNYMNTVTPAISAITALVISSLAAVIIDTLFILTPEVIKKLINKWIEK